MVSPSVRILGWVLLATPGSALAAATVAYQNSNISAPPFRWQDIKYLLAFGDSYTYVQGTLGYPSFSFLGSYLADDFDYTAEQVLADQIVQNFTATAEGGPNWVEFLTGCGVDEGLTSPSSCGVQLWDFAYAGADVSIEFTPQHHNHTMPLVNQTQEFLTYGQPVFQDRLRVDLSETLVAIWIGINDINDTADQDDDLAALYEAIISAIFDESVTTLHSAGYRHFLLLNLPPLDRTPSNVKRSQPVPSKAQVASWGSRLRQHSEGFAASHAGATALVYDANEFLNGVLDDGAAYGIHNTTGFCAGYVDAEVLTGGKWAAYNCSGPIEDYFWFNAGHMTSHVHAIMAADLEEFLVQHSAE